MSDQDVVMGASCRPNFSGAGRRRRRNVAIAAGVTSVGMFGAFVALGVPWPVRLLLAVPVGAAVVSELQVRRNTCVAHAAAGTFEHDDLSTEKVDAEFAAASRKVAATIWRDGITAAVAAGVLAAATAFIR
jgi:hypothetical protein